MSKKDKDKRRKARMEAAIAKDKHRQKMASAITDNSVVDNNQQEDTPVAEQDDITTAAADDTQQDDAVAIVENADDDVSQEETTSAVEIETSDIPLVSVIIPMYNAAMFIAQALESLLNQTMQDFEVVIVDDGSTDNSLEVAKSFEERFDGRLQIVSLPENSGMPGVPRNFGMQIACGKYIAFLDADDMYTNTALEELTKLAEKSQADVVHTDKWFIWDGQADYEDKEISTDADATAVKRAFFADDEIDARLQDWMNRRYRWDTCSSFCKRDFLMSNQIVFAETPVYESMFFNFAALCLAEKYLRIPNTFYIVRTHANALMTEPEPFDREKYFSKWLRILNGNFNAFDDFMSTVPFFQANKDLHYSMLEFIFEQILNVAEHLRFDYEQFPAFELNKFVEKEFNPADAALCSYLFGLLNDYQRQIKQLEAENEKLKEF